MLWGIVLVLSAGFCTSARAAETDQFLAWTRPLKDSTEIINRKVNQEIQIALAEVNSRHLGRSHSCKEVARTIAGRFNSIGVHKLESWANSAAELDRIDTPKRLSIYRNTHWWNWAADLPLSPTIKVNQVLLGTDKLGHYFKQGWRYYERYLETMASTSDEDAALNNAIQVGIDQERGRLGLAITEVFSYVDLEANYQGFLFYKALCEPSSPELTRSETKGWQVGQDFAFEDYINPGFDESYTFSAYTPRRQRQVSGAIAESRGMYSSDRVQTEHKAYREYDRAHGLSYSRRYIQSLIAAQQLPDPWPTVGYAAR